MNLDPNPQPKPNLNNPSKLLDTINLLAYNVRYGWGNGFKVGVSI